jgi:hypothetical protein
MMIQNGMDFAFDKDNILIRSLISNSYQVPRLLCIAFDAWSDFFKCKFQTDEAEVLRSFEIKAAQYYSEIPKLFTDLSVRDLSHLLMCCGVHWVVKDTKNPVPGTKISWRSLTEKSIIFASGECFLIPFSLLWAKKNPTEKQTQIEAYCRQTVKGLNLSLLFTNFDDLCQSDIKSLGITLENMFVASLAVKYYLASISDRNINSEITLDQIYDFSSFESSAKSQLGHIKVNLTNGIALPHTEVFVDSTNYPDRAVIHNLRSSNGHHDVLIPTNEGLLPVQLKSSFTLPDAEYLRVQFQISKTNLLPVNFLILVFLGIEDSGLKDKIVYLTGGGAINDFALTQYKTLKEINSSLNQSIRAKWIIFSDS